MTLCDFLSFANINNGENLQLPLDTQKQNKKHSDLGGGALPTLPLGARHGIQTLCSSELILLKSHDISIADCVGHTSI